MAQHGSPNPAPRVQRRRLRVFHLGGGGLDGVAAGGPSRADRVLMLLLEQPSAGWGFDEFH